MYHNLDCDAIVFSLRLTKSVPAVRQFFCKQGLFGVQRAVEFPITLPTVPQINQMISYWIAYLGQQGYDFTRDAEEQYYAENCHEVHVSTQYQQSVLREDRPVRSSDSANDTDDNNEKVNVQEGRQLAGARSSAGAAAGGMSDNIPEQSDAMLGWLEVGSNRGSDALTPLGLSNFSGVLFVVLLFVCTAVIYSLCENKRMRQKALFQARRDAAACIANVSCGRLPIPCSERQRLPGHPLAEALYRKPSPEEGGSR
jgi:hypothetical protein